MDSYGPDTQPPLTPPPIPLCPRAGGMFSICLFFLSIFPSQGFPCSKQPGVFLGLSLKGDPALQSRTTSLSEGQLAVRPHSQWQALGPILSLSHCLASRQQVILRATSAGHGWMSRHLLGRGKEGDSPCRRNSADTEASKQDVCKAGLRSLQSLELLGFYLEGGGGEWE